MKHLLIITFTLSFSFSAFANFAEEAKGKWNGPCNQDGDHYFRETIQFIEAGKGTLNEEYFKSANCSGEQIAIANPHNANAISYQELVRESSGSYLLEVTFSNQPGRIEKVSIKVEDKILSGPFGHYTQAE